MGQIKQYEGTFHEYEITLDYDFWKADDILRSILPTSQFDHDPPSAYTMTGHLAHLNLRDEYKPYGTLIGQVLLDKNTSIKTVVDKMETIDTKFRTFKMKVIAGEDNFIVTHKESDCLFEFDFSKVYWNSRLSTEHQRLVSQFKEGEAVFDVMAGVGPFALPAAKKSVFVFANDLNPESYKYLNINVKKNKVDKFVTCFNVDGRQFIKHSVTLLQDYAAKNTNIKVAIPAPKKNKDKQEKPHRSHKKHVITLTHQIPTFVSHYVMNLPQSAITFIDAYIGLFSNAFPDLTPEQIKAKPGFKLPTIHVHHFEKFSHLESPEPTEEELHKRIQKQMTELLKFEIPLEKIGFHVVRYVSPNKPMFCISFQLPEEVAFRKL
ncbi:unnamed protein product [Ambrosiozyma monospora]|uniref:Unnamed protein product n=1 Tax=Ambrosiozyma monospora TaxID=43982 RepID=A0ACB5T9F9_AMBMO|nr:unnamed protein product [Ambrosiozyma monospora]